MGTSMDRISQSSAGGLMSSMGKEVVSTPYFVVDERRLLHNLEILKQVAEESGCKILLAQKAFSMFSVYPLLRKYLCGTTASGLYEARLGKEEFGGSRWPSCRQLLCPLTATSSGLWMAVICPVASMAITTTAAWILRVWD